MFDSYSYLLVGFLFFLPWVVFLVRKTLRDNFTGLAVVVFASIFAMPIVGGVHGSHLVNIQIWQPIMLGLFALVFMKTCLTSGTVKRTFMQGGLVLFLMAYVISAFNSQLPLHSVRQLTKIFFVNVLLYFVVVNLIDDLSKAEKIIKLILRTGYVVFAAAIAQLVSYHWLGVNLFYLPGNPRITATFTEAGWFPIYMSYLLALYLPMSSRLGKVERVLLPVLIAVSLMIGLNRGSALAAIITLLAYVLICSVNPARAFKTVGYAGMVGAVVICGIFFFFTDTYYGLTGRFFHDYSYDFSTLQRLAYMNAEIQFIREHPFFGNGVGTWAAQVIPASGITIVDETVLMGGSSFNIFTGILYDAGLLGAVAFLMVLFAYYRQIWRLRTCIPKTSSDNLYVQAAFLVPICLIANSLFNPVYLAGFSIIAFALCVAMLNLLKHYTTPCLIADKP